MQFPAERSEFFHQRFFDEVMNVLGSRTERFEPGGIGFRAIRNFVERRERLLQFRRCENANGLQSFGPRAIDGNLVGQKTAIERKRPLERVELSIWLTFEASSPQPVVFAFRHRFLPSRSRRILRGQHFFVVAPAAAGATVRTTYCLLPSALAFGRTVTGNANKLMNPSASLGL